MLDKVSKLDQRSTTDAWFGGRIPIIIGTVGHRDLNGGEDAVARAVRRELRQIRRTYRNSPFVILSGLAEGADRLVAKLAIEELNAKLIAILPMPEAEFCDDFITPESRDQFRELVGRADAVREMPLQCDTAYKQNGHERNVQYAWVGATIAEQSQILIAIWDRKPSRGLGGTADVVEWFKDGHAPEEYRTYEGDLSLFDPPQPGRCIRIDPDNGNREYYGEDPNARRRQVFRRTRNIFDILNRTDTYNRDVLRGAAHRVKRNPLLPRPLLAKLSVNEAAIAFEEADALAVFYADRVRLADRVLYALALVAVFAFSAVDIKPLASWGFLGVMGIMGAVTSYVYSRSLDTKSLEYRSFAEAMRIMFFWRLLWLKHQLWLSYLSKHGSVVRWLRHAVRSLEFVQDTHQPSYRAFTEKERLDLAIEHWMDSQITYYRTSAVKHLRRYRRAAWVTWIGIGMTFMTSIVLALMSLTYADSWHAWSRDAVVHHPFGNIPIEDFIERLQVVVGLFAAFGLAAKGFLTRNANEELAKQFTAAREIFEKAESSILHTPRELRERDSPGILAQLGREALQEQAEWLWLRHSRPFEALS